MRLVKNKYRYEPMILFCYLYLMYALHMAYSLYFVIFLKKYHRIHAAVYRFGIRH